ncbi:hypothetical protein B0H19DRAFT_1065823 [Mycena capillaripes]|nr:hypothetical protein B0H19DRAFT_1065823 [Mycena capillaripes]
MAEDLFRGVQFPLPPIFVREVQRKKRVLDYSRTKKEESESEERGGRKENRDSFKHLRCQYDVAPLSLFSITAEIQRHRSRTADSSFRSWPAATDTKSQPATAPQYAPPAGYHRQLPTTHRPPPTAHRPPHMPQGAKGRMRTPSSDGGEACVERSYALGRVQEARAQTRCCTRGSRGTTYSHKQHGWRRVGDDEAECEGCSRAYRRRTLGCGGAIYWW